MYFTFFKSFNTKFLSTLHSFPGSAAAGTGPLNQ